MKHCNFSFLIFCLLIFTSCQLREKQAAPKLTINVKMLDSIRQHSDSTYTRPYKRSDWVTAEYFISKKDSTVTQLMKDSAGNIRQFIIEKANRRSYVMQFYSNGQQQYKIGLDDFGQFHGAAEEYNPNGSLKRTGMYDHGLHTGPWKNYDEGGNYSFTQLYDKDGQEIEKYKE